MRASVASFLFFVKSAVDKSAILVVVTSPVSFPVLVSILRVYKVEPLLPVTNLPEALTVALIFPPFFLPLVSSLVDIPAKLLWVALSFLLSLTIFCWVCNPVPFADCTAAPPDKMAIIADITI